MTTFLKLCQNVARESGTFPNVGDPSSTQSQTGRLARLVEWVRSAYEEIQLRHPWRWLQGEFSGTVIANTQRYGAAALGIDERFEDWIVTDEKGRNTVTLYKSSEGQDTEGYLQHVSWDEFRRTYLVGSNASQTGKPIYFSVDQDQNVVLYPIPDAEYVLRGMYHKAPQILAADAETPEMPAAFHKVIEWRALMLLGTFDEAFEQFPIWEQRYRELMHRLELSQLPQIETSGPLA